VAFFVEPPGRAADDRIIGAPVTDVSKRSKLPVALGVLVFLAVIAGAVSLVQWGLPHARDLLVGGRLLRVESVDGETVEVPRFIVWNAARTEPLFVSEYLVLTRIPIEHLNTDAQLEIMAPGCGVFSGPLDDARRVILPPPIRVTVRVPGTHTLCSDGQGIELKFTPEGEPQFVADMLAYAAVEADYWDRAKNERDSRVWIDPDSRSVSMLLPRAGRWRVGWALTSRDPDELRGEQSSIRILWARGEGQALSLKDGQEITVNIRKKELEQE